MANYRVSIPKPSAKRMAKNGKIIVTLHNGWDNDVTEYYDLQENLVSFDFTVPDNYDWKYATSVMDGLTFEVKIKYTNDKGTKEEVKNLVPEKVLENVESLN